MSRKKCSYNLKARREVGRAMMARTEFNRVSLLCRERQQWQTTMKARRDLHHHPKTTGPSLYPLPNLHLLLRNLELLQSQQVLQRP
jgi:hypothetical protein